jgi:hypothetical protein
MTAKGRSTATQRYRRSRDCSSLARAHIAPTGCPPSLHSPRWLSTGCGGRRRQSIPTVSLVSQTPLYDQLRGERINADVPTTDTEVSAHQPHPEPLAPSHLRLVPTGGPGGVAMHGACSGSEADLAEDGDGSGRDHRRDDAHGVQGGAGLCRRQGAEAAEGGSGMAAAVPAGPTAPVSSEWCVDRQGDPDVDTPALTPASRAGQRRQSQLASPAVVRPPVHVRNSQHQRGC